MFKKIKELLRMIFGYTEDKNRVEVPDKEYVDECLCDTGWVVFAEARTYGSFILSEPLEYRKIGNRVYWRTHIKSVASGTPPASQYTYGFNIPAEYAPDKDIQKTFVALNYGDTNAYIVNAYALANNNVKFHIYNTTTITTTDINLPIEFDYIVDEL